MRYAVTLGIVASVLWADQPARSADELDEVGSTEVTEVRAALAEVVKPIADRLSHPDLQVRLGATRQLGKLGPAARSAARPMLRAMKEVAVRPDVSRALGQIGPAALPDLIVALEDSDPFYRIAVLRPIWEILPEAPAEAALLRKLVPLCGKDEPPELRIAAAEVVTRLASTRKGNLGPAAGNLVAALIEGFARPKQGTRTANARALSAIARGHPPSALPALLAALNGKRMPVRVGSAEAIGLTGPAAAAAGPILRKWLDAEQWQSRLAAAKALGGLGAAAAPAAEKLIDIAWVAKPPARADAGAGTETAGPFWAYQATERALIRLGPVAAPAVPALLKVLEDAKSRRWVAAVETLGAIGPPAAPAVPRLIELVRDPNWPFPAMPASALASIGAPAVAPAIELLGDGNPKLRAAGAEILRQLGPTAAKAVGALTKRLGSETSATIRAACLEALTAIGPPAAPVADVIAGMIGVEKDAELQRKMFGVLGAIGTAAVGPLARLLTSDSASLRRQAVATLGWMGPDAAGAAAALVDRLGDPDPLVRMSVPPAAGRIGNPAVAPLLVASRSPNAASRLGSAESLGRIGPAAGKTAGRRLVKLAGDIDPQVRAKAIWALGRMGREVLADRAVRKMLTERLTDPGERAGVRAAAAVALGDAPEPSAALVRTLGRMRSDEQLADSATDALRGIGRTAYPRRQASAP